MLRVLKALWVLEILRVLKAPPRLQAPDRRPRLPPPLPPKGKNLCPQKCGISATRALTMRRSFKTAMPSPCGGWTAAMWTRAASFRSATRFPKKFGIIGSMRWSWTRSSSLLPTLLPGMWGATSPCRRRGCIPSTRRGAAGDIGIFSLGKPSWSPSLISQPPSARAVPWPPIPSPRSMRAADQPTLNTRCSIPAAESSSGPVKHSKAGTATACSRRIWEKKKPATWWTGMGTSLWTWDFRGILM